MPNILQRLKIDPYILAIVGVLILASLLPATGRPAEVIGWIADFAIALLFFLHGARLSREAVVSGIGAVRLHGLVLASTYVLFPLLGLGIALTGVLPQTLSAGMIFLCCLPSTVQSSIAFTSIARGNIPAAVCAATLSNLLGVFLTPILVGIFLSAQGGGFSWEALKSILLQLVLPFAAGQLSRPLIGAWVQKHRKMLGYVDRGSILLVVYTAFSHAVSAGLWTQVSVTQLLVLALVCAVLLAAILLATRFASKALGFSIEDEITAVFCGSKKSLATGVPMAAALFPAAVAGVMVLPLMLFHQLQLIVCAYLAQRYAKRPIT